MELSSDDKYAAAYTNNNQIILLNTLISEFNIIENPFKKPDKDKKDGAILGLRLLNNRLIVIGSRGWAVLDMTGSLVSVVTVPGHGDNILIHSVTMTSPDTAAVLTWSGR